MAKDTIARALAAAAMSSGSSTPYSAGDGIEITDGTINIKYDGETIKKNQDNELQVSSNDLASTITGYDSTKNQVLKNVNGTLTWENVEVYITLG